LSSQNNTPSYGIFTNEIDSSIQVTHNTLLANYSISIYAGTRENVGATPELIIRHNEVNTRSTGISAFIDWSSSTSTTNVIRGTLIVANNNVIATSGTSFTGITATASYDAAFSSVFIDSNSVVSKVSTSTIYGIWVASTNSSTTRKLAGGRISLNDVRIDGPATNYGIYLNNIRSATAFKLENNVVLMSTSSTSAQQFGIYPLTSENIKISQNTVWSIGGSATTARAVYINNSSAGTGVGNTVFNNLIIKDDRGYALEIATTTIFH